MDARGTYRKPTQRHGGTGGKFDERLVDKEWLVVEVRRLQEMVDENVRAIHELERQVSSLRNMLGQAEAGMEMADLIKRMMAKQDER